MGSPRLPRPDRLQGIPSKANAAEFMQYRIPVGFGPSPNTWPRWEPHRAHRTSVLTIPPLMSDSSRIFRGDTGWEKLGQPVPDSNLASDRNRSVPHTTHL